MPNTPLTRHQGSLLAKMLIVGLFVNLAVVGYVFYQSYAGRESVVNSQRGGCERGKKDRIDNAAFQNAHKRYIEKVVLARSVKPDVKAAAREAIKTYTVTAADLTKRAKISCAVAYPKASLLP